MAEIHFYHLERQSLAKLLPTLLQRGLERGWRSVVQVGSDERVEWLSNELWTYSDDSFLPHGTVRDGHGEPSRCGSPRGQMLRTARLCDSRRRRVGAG